MHVKFTLTAGSLYEAIIAVPAGDDTNTALFSLITSYPPLCELPRYGTLLYSSAVRLLNLIFHKSTEQGFKRKILAYYRPFLTPSQLNLY